MSQLCSHLSDLRLAIRRATLTDESALVRGLAARTALSPEDRATIADQAATLVRAVRETGQTGLMESFLAEYGLSTDEGVALMCLAEAMLRVPDTETVDALIQDKITPHDWASHIGDSGSILVNASTWGLLLTGKVLDPNGVGVVGTLRGLVRRLGEPVIRRAVGQAMAEMGAQFVLGETIQQAMERGDPMVAQGYTYSYDMLGEAARTEADALRYHRAYAEAIAAIASRARGSEVARNPGISVKLSALHPRYEQGQAATVVPILADRLLSLARAAAGAGIGLNIDAEEADRLDLSLDVIERVLADDHLRGWDGFGVVVQAFGRRAGPVIEWLYALADGLDRRIMVRLVKGAYWDAEIKRAQVMGLDDYPVFTRKAHTDIAYLAAARQLLSMTDRIYPQFATHNAHSVAAILHLAQDGQPFEFQRLHGMGEALYGVLRSKRPVPCRIYAPVGAHRDLLAYLVRRLLENGANSSFVHQIVDGTVPAEEIARDPIALAVDAAFAPNPTLPKPANLFAPRRNSRGWDITDPLVLNALEVERAVFTAPAQWHAAPRTPVAAHTGQRRVTNPAEPTQTVGTVVDADPADVHLVVEAAQQHQPAWADLGAQARATILRDVADIFEANAAEIFALLAREAGKTLLDGVAELREAVDFLRYYADQAEAAGGGTPPRGVILCISPWNFPLAIFTGQIAAALAAGNAVIAKPAEQTSLIAERAVTWMHQAGVPDGVLHMIPGGGATVGAALVADPRLGGVCFTGSTEVAKLIDRQLAETAPEAMLIAETGGLNAMVVDSTALLEQATRDILRGAFQSAGQRCSALRMLYVQADVAEDLLQMLFGAMDVLVPGDPWQISTDVGPVIDGDARAVITAHVDRARAEGRVLKQTAVPEDGLFVPPTVIRVPGIDALGREVFGPILHVATFEAEDLDRVVDAINGTGYGLTFGLHTRIDGRVQRVLDRVRVGNAYVNRDQIGAVVGSQPFGGHGLSGTGPKAGGPHYLRRFQKPPSAPGPLTLAPSPRMPTGLAPDAAACADLSAWAQAPDRIARLRAALRGRAAASVAAAAAVDAGPVDLPGPTGEANQMTLEPRGLVLCLGPQPDAMLDQCVQALAAGNGVLAMCDGASQSLAPLLRAALPVSVWDHPPSAEDLETLPVDLVALQAAGHDLGQVRRALAERPGPIVPIVSARIDPTAYCTERAVCIDTTAAGGNATLLAQAAD
ncbi:bifunctional protein PutA [Jannaschia pagri]|uniref:Bifunctional protein PutA n=1 Tax=Jannaschia pagri TaxID=2829797 RepID=A0ABQ4NLX4_9RHOB|nr:MULTISPECIES: bifunctional proline dehydrogenase/L-glutamate gamma-semialdehyde dehydrogenase PutA [unclassified Jannaschia]GIT91555.1 bifunctional protein PutA [Jannaschia sp. AI_61]GIT95389.1 bifunctional protein PutA [Jannaschia sp. AI_62]